MHSIEGNNNTTVVPGVSGMCTVAASSKSSEAILEYTATITKGIH